MSKMEMSRRVFIFGTAIMAAGCATTKGKIIKCKPRTVSANEKLNIAAIGIGGKGSSDVRGAQEAGDNNIVALCDVDWDRGSKSFEAFPNAKKYKDFRKMLEQEYKNIDAVTISTPDHMHAPAAIACMQLGKHVYVQKPLTHDIFEARRLQELAHKYGVATQMGNQGHSAVGVRRLTEWIRGGAIGKVTEVHIWTNRPIWPQGMASRPAEVEQIPSTLDWDLWLGTAPERPYNGCYCPFTWRGWWDFGCGALGDMACHIMDPAYTSLQLGYPTSVEPTACEGLSDEAAPTKSTIIYQFPARGDMPPVKVVWYDGGNQPPRPEGMEPDEQLGDGDNGTLFVGDQGMLSCGCYGDSPCFVPRKKMADFKKPPKTIPSSTGHYQEWIDACKGIAPAKGNWCGNFDYAGPFTEVVLLGNVALRAGKKIEYNPQKMEITNSPEMNKFLRREYRKGWGDLV